MDQALPGAERLPAHARRPRACTSTTSTHVQASWFCEGKKTGQVALHFGADDFGGTLFEENVHTAAGYVNKTTVDEIETLIREAGFTPAQRTTLYEILQTY